MRKTIILMAAIFLFAISLVNAQNLAYSLELSYRGGSLSEKKVILIESQQEIKPIVGGEYDVKLYSFNNELLFETSFNFELERSNEANPEWFDEGGNQVVVNKDELQVKQEITKTIFLPYFKEGKEIRIYRYDELKLTIDVSDLASCNNNEKCDSGETHAICPKECSCGNKICERRESYSTCSTDCPKEKIELSLWGRLIGFIKSLLK